MSRRSPADLASSVAALITLTASAASIGVVVTLEATIDSARQAPLAFAAFLVLTIALQFLSVDLYGKGAEGVSAMGMLAAGFALGPGPAMVIAIAAAVTQWIRSRGLLHRAIFDASDFALSAGAAALVYAVIEGATESLVLRAGGAALAGVTFKVLNTGLLCLAMSLSEAASPRVVWRERFRWASLHYLAFGPLAFVVALAHAKLGILGLVTFAVPPALMALSVRQYVQHTRASVEELRRANAELEARHEDLEELFQFAGGLAARAHDRDALIAYAQQSLDRLAGTRTQVSHELDEGAIALVTGAGPVGSIKFGGSPDERWRRLRHAVLPQLSTALESAGLVDEVRRTHVATIAALSRSMEAKDYDTGDHTERVAKLSVALGRRLGYAGAELDAIEIGALLHDIGKIGIPERILHKPGPLDAVELAEMQRHPIISEYILAEIDLPDIVRQIARSSHERIDGAGYPDGLAADRIPLPARIVFVADAFDAMTTDRPYRAALPGPVALAELRANAGTQFCSQVVAAAEALAREEPETVGLGRLRAVADDAA